VTDTLRKKVIDIEMYRDAPQELLVGQVAVLGGIDDITFKIYKIAAIHNLL
jgi:hypothetical protein